MIYTRFGSEVKILKAFPKTSTVKVKRIEDNQIFHCAYAELKADGGIAEIEKEIKIATPTNLTEIGF